MDALPTTPGSIVTFDLPPDSDGTVYRAVAALIAGHIDDEGVAHCMVWASADVQSPDDTGCVFTEDVILRSRPALAVATRPATERPDDFLEEGTVIRIVEHGVPMTYTFAPSFVWNNELQEFFWTNSYGGYWAYDEDAEVEVLYTPDLADRA